MTRDRKDLEPLKLSREEDMTACAFLDPTLVDNGVVNFECELESLVDLTKQKSLMSLSPEHNSVTDTVRARGEEHYQERRLTVMFFLGEVQGHVETRRQGGTRGARGDYGCHGNGPFGFLVSKMVNQMERLVGVVLGAERH